MAQGMDAILAWLHLSRHPAKLAAKPANGSRQEVVRRRLRSSVDDPTPCASSRTRQYGPSQRRPGLVDQLRECRVTREAKRAAFSCGPDTSGPQFRFELGRECLAGGGIADDADGYPSHSLGTPNPGELQMTFSHAPPLRSNARTYCKPQKFIRIFGPFVGVS